MDLNKVNTKITLEVSLCVITYHNHATIITKVAPRFSITAILFPMVATDQKVITGVHYLECSFARALEGHAHKSYPPLDLSEGDLEAYRPSTARSNQYSHT